MWVEILNSLSPTTKALLMHTLTSFRRKQCYFLWINDWVNKREAGDLGRHRAHYDVPVIWLTPFLVETINIGLLRLDHWNFAHDSAEPLWSPDLFLSNFHKSSGKSATGFLLHTRLKHSSVHLKLHQKSVFHHLPSVVCHLKKDLFVKKVVKALPESIGCNLK